MTRHRAPLRALLATVLLVLGAITGAGPAAAHAARLTAEPAEDSEVTQGPPLVSATFSEPLQTSFAAMTVVGPDGNLWSMGPARVRGANVAVDMRPLGPVGDYTVNYRVTSADGHAVNGAWTFHLTQAGTGTPGPPADAAQTGSDAIPVWPFILAAVLIVGAGAWWAVRRRT